MGSLGVMFGKTLSQTARTGWGLAAAVALLLAVSACNRGGDEAETTTSAPTTTAATAATAEEAPETEITAVNEGPAPASGDGTSVATTAPPAEGSGQVIIPPYRVVSDGEPLVAVVEPGSYSAVALENLVYDIVENHSPSAAIVVDDDSAAELAMAEELDEMQQSQLRARTLLRIASGVEVTFYGPYADLPGITVGS